MTTATIQAGVSGMAIYVPQLKVPLEKWCEWNQQPWAKVAKVVGNSFRMPRPCEDVYTMAASAVLRLIQQYQIDPQRIGMLSLGTESSKDNAAGAVIVRGLLDLALPQLGLPPISRHCEVPEFKHACLGGIYALKSSLRYLATDAEDDKIAIAVAADVAEYARGSSGEQTQGAGAVAMLVDREAQMFRLDLSSAGVASAYRGPDFRKPSARHFSERYQTGCQRAHDFPIFSGRYSTHAYTDATLAAVRDLWRRLQADPFTELESVSQFFFHRPYAHMPVSGLAMIYLDALHQSGQLDQLRELAKSNDLDLNEVRAELDHKVDLFAQLQQQPDAQPYPHSAKLAALLRRTEAFKHFCQQRLSLGEQLTAELGNLYTASLPSWVAAGFNAALQHDNTVFGEKVWMVGYGSGDASEAIPLLVSPNWREAAQNIQFEKALAHAYSLNQDEYEALHDHARDVALAAHNDDGDLLGLPPFSISRFGERYEQDFQDLSVPYYQFNQGPV
ncbi:MAG: hypothetical protein MI750_03510 [Xanthomonadales bacterium]|nr:hypothetical protein [Xanthomonadales bacterium]